MLELCLGALSPCSHVMLSQRRRLKDIDPFGRGAEKFLALIPNCCSPFSPLATSPTSLPSTLSASREESLNNTSDALKSLPLSINYGTRVSDSLYGNYHAYLCDARQKITACRIACRNWSSRYDGEISKDSNTGSAVTLTDENTLLDQSTKKPEKNAILSSETHLTTVIDTKENISTDNILVNIQSLLENKELTKKTFNTDLPVTSDVVLSLEEQAKLDADIAELLNENIGSSESIVETLLTGDKKGSDSGIDDSNTAMNSLLSLGESSGYESFAFKGSSESTPENEPNENQINEHEEIDVECNHEPNVLFHDIVESNSLISEDLMISKQSKDIACRQDIFNGQPNVGIFLDVILRKLECMTSNNLYVNLHLTGLISRLAIYPQPLLQSFLLNHSLVFQPSIRSLFQVS